MCCLRGLLHFEHSLSIFVCFINFCFMPVYWIMLRKVIDKCIPFEFIVRIQSHDNNWLKWNTEYYSLLFNQWFSSFQCQFWWIIIEIIVHHPKHNQQFYNSEHFINWFFEITNQSKQISFHYLMEFLLHNWTRWYIMTMNK